MDGFGGYVPFGSEDGETNDSEEDEDDFYGFKNAADTAPGAPMGEATQGAAMGTGDATDNRQSSKAKTAELRAKLLASKSQKSKKQTAPLTASATPFKTAQLGQTPSKASSPSSTQLQSDKGTSDAGNGMYGMDNIDRLIADAKAAAETAASAKAAQASQAPVKTPSPGVSGAYDERIISAHKPFSSPAANGHANPRDEPQEQIVAQPAPTEGQSPDPQHNDTMTASLQAPYYDDLPMWLELTGFHDVEFRTAKLQASKQRKQEMEDLEREAARIADRLKSLREGANVDSEAMRRSVAPTPTQAMAPPPLPPMIPVGHAQERPPNSGMKRPTSSAAARPAKVSRIDTSGSLDIPAGYRIRGTTESDRSSDLAPSVASRRTDHSTQPPDRIADMAPGRRRTSLNPRTGEPSEPERYHQSQETSQAQQSPLNFNNRSTQRGVRRETYGGAREQQRGRQSFDYGPRNANIYHPSGNGIRYFIIKSWNADNVLASQRDSLWATQEKNEELLREAFETSDAVILLFSVNKSMAFQGYAEMTSPPDPSLPKPTFCKKLNWKTSPAFTVRWYATRAVMFRQVGHLKNDLNLDEQGHPLAVLIGKDGTEVSEYAGRGVCEILDDAEHNGSRWE